MASHHPSGGPHGGLGASSDALYKELWHACAGPVASIPRENERVYYFPEGHLEQIEADTSTLLMPLLYLPSMNQSSKTLCKVVSVQLLAEPETDEVYAQMTLLPEEDQSEVTSPDPPLPEPQLRCSVRTFIKTLTTSGILNLEISLPHQEFADMSQKSPKQLLVATDLHGNEWRFRHRFRGVPRRHFLMAGWGDFVRSKRLVAGDALIFLRGENGELRVGVRKRMSCSYVFYKPRGENGELRVGVRKRMRIPASVISSHSMQLGVLATASEAIANGMPFSVFYKPRKLRPELIVSVNKYLEARNHKFSVGMRFKMRFEGEEVPERRFSGTIVGVEENTSLVWLNSKWRPLKVHWDEPASILLPDRVSPWELEPFEAATPSLEPFVAATPSNSQAAQPINRPLILPSLSLDLSLSVIGLAPLPTLPEESISSMTPTPDLSILGMAALSTPLQEDSMSICSESICSN